jgi:aspartyl protease family protein
MRFLLIMLFIGGVVTALSGTGRAPQPSASMETTPDEGASGPRVAEASGSSPSTSRAGETVLQREANGHFYADAQVNYGRVRFLIDTGASTIALTQDDARRANVSFDTSRFEPVGSGASGPVYGQVVMINSIEIEGKRATGLPGVVLRDADTSLLGQSFLRRMQSVAIEGDRMVLR